jgi:hypothetical protein
MDCVVHTLLLSLHLGRTGGGSCAGILTCSMCAGSRLNDLLLLRGGNGWRGAGSVLNALAGGDYDVMISITLCIWRAVTNLGFLGHCWSPYLLAWLLRVGLLLGKQIAPSVLEPRV